MNRSELITLVAAKTGLTKKDTEKTLVTAFETISDSLLHGESVKISNFGTFEIRERNARIARNPRTNVTVKVAPTKAVRFRPGKILNDISVINRESEE